MLSPHVETASSRPPRSRARWLAVAWALGVALVVFGRVAGVDASQGRYRTNYPADFGLALAAISVECGLLYVLLCPQPARARVARATLAAIVALAAVPFTWIASWHAGSILIGTFLWTLPLALATVLNAIDTYLMAYASRRRAAT